MKQTKWAALSWISVSVLCALSLWFSASAVMSELTKIWGLTEAERPWLSAAVPAGFVAGAIISSIFGLADRYNARKLFAVFALIGALLNSLLLFADSAAPGIILRFLTGAALAGVYPTAVKVLTLWFPKKRGLAVGIVIGALTIGSALPHLIVLLSAGVDWKGIIATSSMLAVLAAAIMNNIVKDAPQTGVPAVFSFKMIGKVIRNKPVMLANYGYFGHMWELYAMWTWLPAFFLAAGIKESPLFSFLSIGLAGAAGCIAGGIVADKIGRARVTIWAMGISAACSVSIGFAAKYSVMLVLVIAIIWGGSIIADSAQFSAAVSEFAETEWLGTALTFQMSIGFFITIVSINLISFLQPYIGWEWVFSLLAVGPAFGMLSMMRFKCYEERRSM